MKKISKVIAFCLVAVMAVGLFAACGNSYNFTSADVVDSSENQQRWLKYPGSDITINPSAVNGTDSSDTLKQALSIGIGDKALDNVLFTLENLASNGVSGSNEWEADFSPETTPFKGGMSKLTNNSKGSALNVVVPEDVNGKALSASAPLSINNPNEARPYDFVNKKYYLVVESGECAEMADIHFYTFNPVCEPLAMSIGSNETKVVCLNDVCEASDPALITENTTAYFDIRFKVGGAYQFNSFAVKVIDSGVQPAASSSLEWAPYSIKNTATFPNGTVIESQDFFFDTNTVTRRLVANSSGMIVVGGAIADGAAVNYIEKDGVIEIDGANGINYSVRLGVKDTVKFYASEADMLADKNALDSANGAKYWVSHISDLSVGDPVYFAVSASTQEKAITLTGKNKNSTSQSRARKRLETLPAEWDEYIKSHGDVETYIKNIPESK